MLTEIDPKIFKQKLQYLSLRGNNIPIIPEDIVNATDMIYLDLGNCNVSELADISVMRNLKALDISYSDLESLPEFITNSSLEALYVSGCDFNIKDFAPPAMIKYLDVSSNQTLLSLTDAIINLEELVYLNISDLGLMALPLETSWHYSISHLDISNNQIEILPYAFHSVDVFVANRNLFKKLPLLTGNYMDFRANRLTHMPVFAGNLIMLDYNMISGAEDQLIKPSMLSVKVVDGIINLKFSPTSQRDGNMSLLGYRILKNDEVLDVLIKTTTSWQGESVLPGEIHRIRVETINVINDDDLGKFNLSDGRNGIASLPAPPTPKPTLEPTPQITPIPTPEPTQRFPIPWIPLLWYFSPAYVIIVIGIILAIIRRGK